MSHAVQHAPVELDEVPLNRFHIKIAALTFGAHFNDGFAIGIIGIVLTLIGPEMGLTDAWKGALGAGALFGLFVGSFFLGWLSDYVGRQKIFLSSFVLITVATALQFWAQDPWQLLALRILVGIGLGGDYSVGHAILAEFSPRKHRGVLLASFSVIWTFGYVFATVLGVVLINAGIENAWRWMLVSPALIAAVVLVARMGTPESPRWLVSQGRKSEAIQIVRKYFGEHVVLNSESHVEQHDRSGFAGLFQARYIRRTIFNCLFFSCIVMPYFAIYTFLPNILSAMNLSDMAQAGGGFMTEIYLSMFLLVGALIGIYCTHKMTRRGFLIGSFVSLTVSLSVLAVLPTEYSLVLITVFAFFTLVLSAVSNLVGVFPAESFPTELRSSGIGFATAISRLASVVSTFFLPMCMTRFGVGTTMGLLAVFLLIGTIVSIAWAPETKGKQLSAAAAVDEGAADMLMEYEPERKVSGY